MQNCQQYAAMLEAKVESLTARATLAESTVSGLAGGAGGTCGASAAGEPGLTRESVFQYGQELVAKCMGIAEQQINDL